MSYEKVVQAKQIVVGTKQTVRALKEGNVKEVVVAEDADLALVEKVVKAASDHNVPIVKVDSMKKLGRACRIDVGAVAVAIIR